MKDYQTNQIFLDLFKCSDSLKGIIVSVLFGEKDYDQISADVKATYGTVQKAIARNEAMFRIRRDNKRCLVELSSRGFEFIEQHYENYLKMKKELEAVELKQNEQDSIINRLKDFLDADYNDQVADCLLGKKKRIDIDFQKLSKFDVYMADRLIDSAFETLNLFQLALDDRIDYGKARASFYNLPSSSMVNLCDVREMHIGKLITVTGDIKQKTPPKAVVTKTHFSCPACGNKIKVKQTDDQKYREPSYCPCGRKGRFIIDKEEIRDEQRMVISESLEQIDENRQPRSLNCILTYDLTSPILDKKTNPGNKIQMVGLVDKRKIKLSPANEYVLIVNSLKVMEEDYSEVVVSKEDIKIFEDMKDDPCLLEDFAESAYGEIQGHNEVKRALILQQFGGSKVRLGSKTTRANSHIALIGDPSTAKTDLLKLTRQIAPKSRYAVGSAVSKAGLIGCVRKDEFLGDYMLEGGVLSGANKGLAIIDELDKASDDDKKGLNEPLENETITIDKANIHAVLPANTTVLIAANPKKERFDNYTPIGAQIDLPNAIFTRFDLIFVMRDLPEDKQDELIAASIICRYNNGKSGDKKLKYSTDFIRRYIAHAKRTYVPSLSDKAMLYLQRSYVKLRGQSQIDGAVRISFSPRQLEGIIRLSQAYAKMRLRNEVTEEDCVLAKDLLLHSLKGVGVDPETGKIDIDYISGKSSSGERNKMHLIIEMVSDMHKSSKLVAVQDLIQSLKGTITETEIEKIVKKMCHSGELVESKKGYVQKVK